MGEIYFTADTHFCHNHSFLYEPRGFASVEEMNEVIVERWNKIVKPDDTVYHLGDVLLNNNVVGIEYLKRLNGHIFLIFGNHDTNVRKTMYVEKAYVVGGWYAWLMKIDKMSFYLSHYPTLTANFDDKYFNQHVINLHGHTHQQMNFLEPDNPFMYHVGLDSHNCTPVHIDTVMSDIHKQYDLCRQNLTLLTAHGIFNSTI